MTNKFQLKSHKQSMHIKQSKTHGASAAFERTTLTYHINSVNNGKTGKMIEIEHRSLYTHLEPSTTIIKEVRQYDRTKQHDDRTNQHNECQKERTVEGSKKRTPLLASPLKT